MNNIPESLRKALSKLPQKTQLKKPDLPVASEYSQYDVTTIYRDGTVIKSTKQGRKSQFIITPIS